MNTFIKSLFIFMLVAICTKATPQSFSANFIVDSQAGTISSEGDKPTSYLRITQSKKVNGKYVITVSQQAQGLGNFTSWQYNTTTGSMTGTF